MNPSCKIIVESLNPENIDHFRRAGADEIICIGDISSKLIFRSSMYSGVTNLFRELLTNDYGNEIYSDNELERNGNTGNNNNKK
ncbi:MAG: Kef-type K+ transport system, predicted NAD-binding component [Desulfotomaculum sp. 46_80]|nr:MAG: Kef-type K+ transport system, predicted NAD-binding component [Desulfotomaculum sp. 46_80]